MISSLLLLLEEGGGLFIEDEDEDEELLFVSFEEEDLFPIFVKKKFLFRSYLYLIKEVFERVVVFDDQRKAHKIHSNITTTNINSFLVTFLPTNIK